ncbi:TrkA-N domain protein [Denitrovibrio acetiphilus DSM 12809]|uniref:TrkA-N domain protein n=1 Tax=Denitrovibrio acetiphilus (strain DSM 12809 / NBRC 114555 / N2460) TaxID=522772 RepID=D4H7Q7_DENA2|nr:TrkA family potassium uptake protein [Denitrovibrio acetiphilus]ADD68056.1 TrkA-N domain protein [Denitrovibrio acetiphilus DSM 12809]
MAQQILIIGLGHFGMSLAKTLSEKGAEVLAVDKRINRVEEASAFVTEAVVMDATDEAELAKLEPKKRDSSVCTIGEDSKDASIICTALLRQMGAPLVISRASDKMHQRILSLVGAHQVVDPEQEFGYRFANKLLFKNIIIDNEMGENMHLTEMCVLPEMIGKTLIELALPKRFGVMVVAIRKGQSGKLFQPNPSEPLDKDDTMIIVSTESAIPKLIKGV